MNELEKNKLTYVGTLRKNKKEISQQFLPNKARDEQSSIFGFTHDNSDITEVLY